MNVRVIGELILSFGNRKARRNGIGGPLKGFGKQGLGIRFDRDFTRDWFTTSQGSTRFACTSIPGRGDVSIILVLNIVSVGVVIAVGIISSCAGAHELIVNKQLRSPMCIALYDRAVPCIPIYRFVHTVDSR